MKRYCVFTASSCGAFFADTQEDDQGEWVKYEDAMKEIAGLRRELLEAENEIECLEMNLYKD